MSRGNLILLLLLVLGVGGGIAAARLVDPVRAARSVQGNRPPEALLNLQDTLAAVAEHVKPFVVHITTKYRARPYGWWGSRLESTGVGSGIIVNAGRGTILTNHHVIQGAREIFVMLHDGRVLRAGVVGSDPETDVAVIQLVSPPPDLKEARLGDSDRVRVGDFVLAVGSPFGLHHTVTFGIVSGKGRRAKLVRYEDYIQTTADIHPGSSGGPLVNLYGEVIAINAAIVVDKTEAGRARAGSGISFAIPINLVKWVMGQLIRFGEVHRGFIGIGVDDFSELSAAELGFQSLSHMLKEFGLKEPQGVIVREVFTGYPADRAGLVIGDVLTHINGERLRDSVDAILRVGQTMPGEVIKVRILRAGQLERRIDLKVAERPTNLDHLPRRGR